MRRVAFSAALLLIDENLEKSESICCPSLPLHRWCFFHTLLRVCFSNRWVNITQKSKHTQVRTAGHFCSRQDEKDSEGAIFSGGCESDLYVIPKNKNNNKKINTIQFTAFQKVFFNLKIAHVI